METGLLPARVRDAVAGCVRSARPKYLGFLSEEEAALAAAMLKAADCRTAFFGGYENAHRVMLGCFPDWCEEDLFPIQAVTFSSKEEYTLRHRDVLGTLMALGLRRETVGDILVGTGKAVVFVTEEVARYVTEQVTKIGGVGVSVSEGASSPLPEGDRLVSAVETVSSDRLDCVIAALCGFSRGAAKEAIEAGLVTLNSFPQDKATKTVAPGDILSVRGKGRFAVTSFEGRTKKNRLIMQYQKFV